MKTLSDLRNRLVLEEGLRLKPYRCTSGKLTIGVGRNLEDKGITEQEAMIMLDADIQYFQFQLATKIKGWKDIHITARLVLIDMAFNMGVAGLLKFKKTLRLIQEGKHNDAAIEMLDSRWANQVGKRATELSKTLSNI